MQSADYAQEAAEQKEMREKSFVYSLCLHPKLMVHLNAFSLRVQLHNGYCHCIYCLMPPFHHNGAAFILKLLRLKI